MVTIQHSPPAVGGRGEKDDPYDYTKDFDTEKSRLVSLLTEAEFHVPEDGHPPLKVTSIFFQEYGGLSSPPPGHPVQVSFFQESFLFLTLKLFAGC
jgi:tRNA (uracil-5-)-methyltransferase